MHEAVRHRRVVALGAICLGLSSLLHEAKPLIAIGGGDLCGLTALSSRGGHGSCTILRLVQAFVRRRRQLGAGANESDSGFAQLSLDTLADLVFGFLEENVSDQQVVVVRKSRFVAVDEL